MFTFSFYGTENDYEIDNDNDNDNQIHAILNNDIL